MTVTTFQDLPLADRDRAWDGDAADKRVRKWADATDEPDAKYRDAHVWYDADNKDEFGAYKLLIADVIDGRLKAVPRGVMAAGNVMQGARGGVDLPPRTSTGSSPTWPGTTPRWATPPPGTATDHRGQNVQITDLLSVHAEARAEGLATAPAAVA